MKKHSVLYTAVLLLLTACTKQTIKPTPLQKEIPPVTVKSKGDTTTYVISFMDRKEKRIFSKDFKEFITTYPVKNIVTDTVNQYYKVMIIPPEKEKDTGELLISPQDTIAFTETDIEAMEKIITVDTVIPTTGGKAVIYTPRSFIDRPLSELTTVFPFPSDTQAALTAPDTAGQLIIIAQASPKKIQIECTDWLINGLGHRITAFDLVQAWTDFVKKQPMEGLALFPFVKGIRKFIKGEEGIITGFSIINDKIVRITLEKPDPFSMKRLESSTLLPPVLSLGKYYIKKQQADKLLLMRNDSYFKTKAFLDQCTIICGNDRNPIVSYSLNRYDVVILSEKKDLEYVERKLSANSKIIPFSKERYFISIGSQSPAVRKNLVQVIDPYAIHAHAVKAESEVIAAIETENPISSIKRNPSQINTEAFLNPVSIAYNTEDPVSIYIAEKIFSDLTHIGIRCKLDGMNTLKMQHTLFKRTYDLAVGWITDSVTANELEKLRLATIWFNGITDESQRIAENLEIPLFSINRYALCKKAIHFYKDVFSGIYRQIE